MCVPMSMSYGTILSKIGEANQTNLCLIPKITNPQYVHQFRLIALCNTIYKVLSKISVNRLRQLMAKIVSPYQFGFIIGRRI